MVEFPFNWPLQRSNSFHSKKNRPVSNLKINDEWTMECLWTKTNPYKPKFIEILRNSKGKETLVSGTLKLMIDQICVQQQKFVQLIEADSLSTLIYLDYSYVGDRRTYGDRHNYFANFFISGTITIPASQMYKEYAKGMQFDSLLNLSDNFESLLDPKATYFSDVSLNCGTVSLPAHKNILSARSPVFAAMFTNQMKENRENKVNITDLSPHILKTMLTHMYTGKTGELSHDSAGELLFAADKYELLDLKRVCCDYLKRSMSADNVMKILVLGYSHDINLKEFAINFICNSCEEFEVMEKTIEWRKLRDKIPALAMDVLTSLVKSKDKKIRCCQVNFQKISLS